MKAMGADSDQEVVSLIGAEDALQQLLLPSLQEAKALGVFSSTQALEFMAGRLAQRGPPRAFSERRRKSKVDEARDVLANVVLCHVPVVRYGFGPKLLYTAVMVRRMAAAILDRTFLDDRDYYGNKRLELAGGRLGAGGEGAAVDVAGVLMSACRATLRVCRQAAATPLTPTH